LAPTTSRLALGTVQLGLPYGVANRTGQPSPEIAAAILSVARNASIDTIDTAAMYGASEDILGMAGVASFRVVTKAPALAGEADPAGALRRSLETSLARLQLSSVDALLLHDAGDATGEGAEAIACTFRELKAEGLTRAAGVSIYRPSDLDSIADDFPLDFLQAPLNVFDQRVVRDDRVQRLCGAGMELHVRSAFLQGVLLQAPVARRAYFAEWGNAFSAYDEFVQRNGGDRLAACLGFALDQPNVTRVVVGVETPAQLAEIVRAADRPFSIDTSDLAQSDVRLIEPRHWDTD